MLVDGTRDSILIQCARNFQTLDDSLEQAFMLRSLIWATSDIEDTIFANRILEIVDANIESIQSNYSKACVLLTLAREFIDIGQKKRGEEDLMSRIEIRNNESLEKALRRFKRKIEKEGILKILKARKHYEKPSERKRKKRRALKMKPRLPLTSHKNVVGRMKLPCVRRR